MTSSSSTWAEGGCPCRTIRYRLEQPPLIVHCCHCTWCQKESGSAFALNAMIESKSVTLLTDATPTIHLAASPSGSGQNMACCPSCQFVVWSNYGGTRDVMRAVRVGTLDEPQRAPPNIHIFTSTKLPWVVLGDGIPIKEEYYVAEEVWSASSLERREEMRKSAAK